MKRTVCQACGYRHDMVSNVGDGRHAPVDGDVSICLRCAAVSLFDSTTPAGLAPAPVEVLDDPEIKMVVRAVHVMNAAGGGVPYPS